MSELRKNEMVGADCVCLPAPDSKVGWGAGLEGRLAGIATGPPGWLLPQSGLLMSCKVSASFTVSDATRGALASPFPSSL